jgi:hypothetical protein
MKRSMAALGFAALLVLSGCVGYDAPVVPPGGYLYTNTQAPNDIDADASQLGTKRGESTSSTVLGLVAWGDASVYAAANAGGITTIRHVDYKYNNILSVYATFTTVVYGD